MVNLLAQMGIQPETLAAGLVVGVMSTDHTAPTATISPISGTVIVGSHVNVAGTAHDLGGGVVAGVEFSADSGLTWHPAAGGDNWNYSWIPNKVGTVTIEARAVDDSLNIGTPTSTKLVVGFQQAGFDPGYYLQINPDVKAAGIDPYTHYITYGWKEGRNPSAFFSTKDYLAANPDVANSGMNPLTHFETYGWKEGRNPSPSFDVGLYLAHNTDVQKAGLNPLDHYIVYGQAEGRADYTAIGKVGLSANGFDQEYYLFNNPDVAKAHVDPYLHYLNYGAHEGRNPNPYFDTNYYLANNPDVAKAGIDPLVHYDLYGWKEGRNPSANFDTNAYLAANPDVAKAGIDPLVHFLEYGVYEGRDPHGGVITT